MVPEKLDWGYHRPVPGDVVLVNGSLGNHGLTILAARENLGLDGALASDCAPLNNTINLLQKHCSGIKMMRDLTRGGLATAAKEIAEGCGLDIRLREYALPIDAAVRGAAEILGLDPLYLANEGKFLVIIDPAQVTKALDILKQSSYGRDSQVIGQICAGSGNVYLQTPLGGTKI